MKREEGIIIARRIKELLLERGYPIREVLLYGSVARNEANHNSDIDIAIVCEPFKNDTIAEGVEIRTALWHCNEPIDTICLHSDSMNNVYSPIVQQIKKEGIAV